MEWLIILLFLGGIVYIAYNAFLFALWLLKKILPSLILLTFLFFGIVILYLGGIIL